MILSFNTAQSSSCSLSQVILTLVASSRAQWPVPERVSAASNAQIRFAEENKYDSTGPGAKEPEYAYRTYETLDEALIAYVNDPDTQLPEYEKNRALQSLQGAIYNEVTPIPRYQPKTVDLYTGYKPQQQSQNLFKSLPNTYTFTGNDVGEKSPQNFKFQKYQTVKLNPIALTQHRKTPESYYKPEPQPDFDDNPQYTFSYGVHVSCLSDSLIFLTLVAAWRRWIF